MHSGTLDSKKILNWVYVLLKMKKWALNNYNDKLIQEAIKLKTGKKKYDLFMKAFNFNKNPEIKAYINERISKFNPAALENKANYWITKRRVFDLRKENEIIGSKIYELVEESQRNYKKRLPYDEYSARTKIIKMLETDSKKYKMLKGKQTKNYATLNRQERIMNELYYKGGDE